MTRRVGTRLSVFRPWEGGRRGGGEGGGEGGTKGGRGREGGHLMSSVCIDVRPARLVESAAAPSGPMPFELRESKESRRVRENGPGCRGVDFIT